MISLTCFNRRFTPDWRMTILAFFAILLFCRLGFWQLERAKEKKQMMGTQASLAKLAPLAWQPAGPLPKQYQPIRVRGHYLEPNLLLDNQHHQHQFGYHVLTPFLLDSGKVLLVDRGWVVADIRRQVLPDIARPLDSDLEGTVYYPSEKTWVLGQVLEKKGAKIAIVERIDVKIIGQFLHKSVYPFIIRLNNDGSQGYVREWPVVAMLPERHYGYAFQWFAIASVLLILFIALNLKKNYEND
ncbi:MAG: SURF1 family protein [Tatlockia sp.]|nr:SURF1 family protein [Tatlockia sp.]